MNLNRSVLAKASLMDKRFSQLKFLGQEEKDRVLGEIKTGGVGESTFFLFHQNMFTIKKH